MAGDYQILRLDIHEDPAVIAIAARLEMDDDHVVGKLAKLWGWANRQTADGNALGVTKEWLDRYVGVPGFAEAMVGAGWLHVSKTKITFPKFDRWMSDSAKTRAKGRKRKQKFDAKRNVDAVTKALPEERRGDKSKKKTPYSPPRGTSQNDRAFDPAAVPLPPELDTAKFREAWAEWIQHRSEIGKKLTRTSVKRQLKTLVAVGPEVAIATIEHTIGKGWTGLRAPDGQSSGGNRAMPTGPGQRLKDSDYGKEGTF